MTGRELIQRVVESCSDLDAPVSVFLLHRDADNCVETKDWTGNFHFINGKIQVEANTLIKGAYR